MKKISSFIVKNYKLFLALFIIIGIACAFTISKVKIEYSITSYLPAETDTKIALDIMDKEFVTYGSSTILVRNISFEEASDLVERIEDIKGVKSLPFENTREYYNQSSALFNITYDGSDEDQVCVDAYNKVIEMLKEYDSVVASPLVDNYADQLMQDVIRILFVVLAIIIVVLLLTSKSFAEVIVFLIVFGFAALINMGTNYWLGTISFVSNSVCVILQLALAIDYAIILSHRFAEEKEKNHSDPAQSMVQALSKAISEIFGSSLTTIAGLLSLCCMTLRLGADLGICLAKSIVCSMLTVFLLMPALMMIFTKLIDKTTHRNLVPKITWFGKSVVKLRFILPVLFLVIVCAGGYFTFNLNYCYSANSIDTSKPTESMIAVQEIEDIFGSKNTFVVLVPKGDYENERAVIEVMRQEELITDITAISDVSIYNNGQELYLTQGINYKDFASFIGVSEDISKNCFLAYAYLIDDNLEQVAIFEANPDIYQTTLLDLVDCAINHDDFIKAFLNESEILEDYESVRDQIKDAEDQLIGENYTRIVCNIDAKTEDTETFDLIERMNTSVKTACPGTIFAGDSMSSYDLNSSFAKDNILISVLTIVFVYLILMFTVNSWGIPAILVATIQGAIFINFAIPVLQGSNLFFFVYLIVSSIQMGATIDYAIVITGRYGELVEKMDKKNAVVETLNQCFPTIATSGIILMASGFLVYAMVTDPLISTLGLALGRGTIISILSVMCVLPVLLYFFYNKLSKTRLPKFKLEFNSLKVKNMLKDLKKDEKKD